MVSALPTSGARTPQPRRCAAPTRAKVHRDLQNATSLKRVDLRVELATSAAFGAAE
jgi:hypothetical protein